MVKVSELAAAIDVALTDSFHLVGPDGSRRAILAQLLGLFHSSTLLTDAAGGELQMVSAILRRTGGAWDVLSGDGQHGVLPVTGMTAADVGATQFKLTYGFTAESVYYLTGIHDEGYARPPASTELGPVHLGSSVGLTETVFTPSVASPTHQSYLCTFNGSAWVIQSWANPVPGYNTGLGISESSGVITITHPASSGYPYYGHPMNPDDHVLVPSGNSISGTQMKFVMRDADTGAVKTSFASGNRFLVHRQMADRPLAEAPTNADLEIASANFWVFGFLRKAAA